MAILFRAIWVIIAAFLGRKMDFCGVSLLPQRVWPIDLDINVHMNNARYLSVMDLGRIDWIIRTGAWRLMRYEGMAPVVGGCMVRYRRSLKPFQAYRLRSRLIGWDDKWAYFEQVMESRDGIACLAVQRAGFTQKGKLVPPAEIGAKLSYSGPIMPAPAWVAGWAGQEAEFVRQAEGF